MRLTGSMSDVTVRPVRLIVTMLVAGAIATLFVWPQLFGVQRLLVFSQVVAFRAVAALALCIAAALFAVVAWRRKMWGIAAGVAIVCGVASIAGGAVLVGRGAATGAPSAEITVVAWNTQGGAETPANIALLVADVGADIVSLPETDESAAEEVVGLLASKGYAMTAHTTRGESGDSEIPTSVLIADHLGAYEVDGRAGSTPDLPSVVLRSADGTGPTIVAAHPFPPLPSKMDSWRVGLEWVADKCDDPDVIVAGDLNATVDHLWGLGDEGALIGACEDASLEVGAAAVGTWPVSVPAWLAAPIDHVLIGPAWTVRGVSVVTSLGGDGSDHRPIVAELDRR